MSPAGDEVSVFRPGGITYLHIPAAEPPASAAFYRAVCHWEIRGDDPGQPSFTDGSGQVIGHWVAERAPAGNEVGLWQQEPVAALELP